MSQSSLVSAIIATYNRGYIVHEAIDSVLAQTYTNIEVIVVDDRSSDGTPDILRSLAKEDSRLQVIRIDKLPEGWLGKCTRAMWAQARPVMNGYCSPTPIAG